MTPVIRGDQRCPICGLPPDSIITRAENGVHKANMLDAQGHIWNITWPVVVT